MRNKSIFPIKLSIVFSFQLDINYIVEENLKSKIYAFNY